MSPMESTQ